MRILEQQLNEIFHDDEPSRYVPSRTPLYFAYLAGEVRFFAAPSIQPISEFYRRYHHLMASYESLPQMKKSPLRTPDQLEWELRVNAGFALQMLVEAVRALKNEGGVVDHTEEWTPAEYPALPPIPSPAFAVTSKADRVRAEARGA